MKRMNDKKVTCELMILTLYVHSMCSVADDKKDAVYVVFKQSKITLEPLLACNFLL